MLYIRNPSLDPYFNLAAEEYLLDNLHNDIFMLWINSDAVIVGRNQNTLAEINIDYIRENNIAVVRRLTGGGAVFHDRCNVNFTFIRENDLARRGSFADFSYFASFIIGALADLGVAAETGGRNDLLISGRKFSGNAQCVRNGRVMHHGTLLLDVTAEKLEASLTPDADKIKSGGVRSIRSRVTGINEHISDRLNSDELIDIIHKYMTQTVNNISKYELSETDLSEIAKLADQKYRTWKWNFGESPKYNFSKKARFIMGGLDVNLQVESGVIAKAKIHGDYFGEREISEFEDLLLGISHSSEELRIFLDKMSTSGELKKYFLGISVNDLLTVLF